MALGQQGKTIADNRYDAEGLRHEIEENGKLVKFIYNENREVVVERTGENLKRLIKSYDLWASECTKEKTWYHYASDEQGSIVCITDEEEVKNRYEYDAWENAVECEEQVENRYKYTGQQYDPVTQQYYLRARYYNPVIARFTQEDVYRGDGLNLYAYCENNPVMSFDPSGYASDCMKDAYTKQREQQKENGREDYDSPAAKKEAHENAKNQVANQKANQPPKPQPQKPNASADKHRQHGGYKVNDSDRYGNLSPASHRATGHTVDVADNRVQAHHPVQNKWAKNNIKGYNEYDAPSILLPSSSGMEHAKISSAQRERRKQEPTRYKSTTLKEEMNLGYSEMMDCQQ